MEGMSEKRHEIQEHEIQSLKLFKPLSSLLARLHEAGCARDRAGNREFHMDQYLMLILLYLFNPICVSLRSLQQASTLRNVWLTEAFGYREHSFSGVFYEVGEEGGSERLDGHEGAGWGGAFQGAQESAEGTM